MPSNRCFILGNGPSLADTPLDELVGEITFACNRINLIFPYTKWRPTYYVRSEQPVDEDEQLARAEVISILDEGAHGFFPITWKKWLGYHPNAEFRNTCRHFKYDKGERLSKACNAWHFPMLCDYGSCVTMAIQVANQLGYDVIYLLGCDLGFTDDNPDHFYDEIDKSWPADKRLSNILHAHETAKRESDAIVYNATIGGQLEVYPRVDIFDVLDT